MTLTPALPILTLADIRAHSPCYDPATKVPESWTGSVLDILRMEDVPAKDRIWVATKFLEDRTKRLFAVWCARQALALVKEPDPRSLAACDVAERFARGEATEEERAVAAAAAANAANAANAADAAYAAYAAYAAAAADAYAADAAYAAYAAADAAAYVAAREHCWKAQVRQLAEMIEEGAR